jgi:5'(3')-deoxyribonucleotidase
MLKVGLDCDNVLYPFTDAFAAVAVRTGRRLSPQLPVLRWEFWRDWGFTADDYREVFTAGAEDGWLFECCPPAEGAVDAVRRLVAAGHEVHMATSRTWPGCDAQIRAATFRWLGAHKVPLQSVTFTDDKTVVECDLFVDDHPDAYRLVDDAGEAVPVLWHHPSNEGFRSIVQRVHDWDELESLVEWVTIHLSEAEGDPGDPFDRQGMVREAVDTWFHGMRDPD